ncbi:MAG: response regulator transcription factor [Chryseolinea sp.]
MEKINILVVDDEALIREGLKALLEKEPFIHTIFLAANRMEFEKHIANNIGIVLMDFRLLNTNGIELLELLKKHENPPRIIVLTGLEGSELIMNLLQAGVHGIVYKLDGYQELIKTIHKIQEVGSYFSEKILNVIKANAHKWDTVPPVVLSFSERELLKAIASGLTTKEIAPFLKMSEATTETYRIRLIRKVGVHNTAGLLAYSYRNGLL